MFADSDVPDFDSMSQEELIAWLEQLAQRHDAASEIIDDYDSLPPAATHELDELESEQDEDWQDWRDSGLPGDVGFVSRSGLGQGAFDPPIDLELLDDVDGAATASLDWLDEIIAAQTGPPDLQGMRAQSSQERQPLPDGEAQDDPLDWLNGVAGTGAPDASASNQASPLEIPDDVDETWEDDESLDDLEDESLYTYKLEGSARFADGLADGHDSAADEQSTQSMAPLPDDQPAESPRQPAQPPARRQDSLTQAFLIQQREHDLEAWYAERLRAIASPPEAAPAPPPPVKPGKPPPPGLAAAINSARGKAKAGNLTEALLDYETLLGTTAGLQWVVHDMRELIAQAAYRQNASAHRVLGDALMRQGQLDAALDVYRHALSLL